jgi:hypothetical protein
VFDGDVYEPVTRAVGSQREVGNRWARGELPVHEIDRDGRARLRTGTENYVGYQYPDGYGYTKHYGVTNAVRTRHGVFILNPNDYAKGRAILTYPSPSATPGRYRLPLDQIDALSRKGVPSRYDIFDIIVGDSEGADGYDRLVTFEDADGHREHYRAARNAFDAEPLDPDHDVPEFLDTIDP